MKRRGTFVVLVVFQLTALAPVQAAYGHERHRGHHGKADDLAARSGDARLTP